VIVGYRGTIAILTRGGIDHRSLHHVYHDRIVLIESCEICHYHGIHIVVIESENGINGGVDIFNPPKVTRLGIPM
jgi:hypothetical protein